MKVAIDNFVPAFVAPSRAGKARFTDLHRRTLILYFWLKDNHACCASESADFATRHAEFTGAGAQVLGVSRDSLRSDAGFKAKMELPFDLVADTDETPCELST